MTAIALIAGFALGAGCTAALLVGLRAAMTGLGGGAAGKAEDAPGGSEAVGKASDSQGAPVDRQWQNLWNYNGTPQKTEGVNGNGNEN